MLKDIRHTIKGSFPLIGGDFTNASGASPQLKQRLIELGINDDVVKRAAIVAFEAEMNVIIYAVAGWLWYYFHLINYEL